FLLYGCYDKNYITECKIEDNETEIIAKKLAKVIEEQHPEMAYVYIYDKQKNEWIFGGGANGYKLDTPFIRVAGDYYHLKYLVMYTVSGALKLYFNY
ncbi:MAG: hypothetical protein CR986_03720, partial [Ignavibacteriae bacterium]